MARQVFINNLTTNIAEFLSANDTTITVGSSTGAPTLTNGDWFMATIALFGQIEIVRVTAVTGNNWTVVRGQEGTSAYNWLFGATIDCRITRGTLDNFVQDQEFAEYLSALYNVNPALIGNWTPGAVSTPDRVWVYNGRLWTGVTGALPAAPSFEIAYWYVKPGEAWMPEMFGAVGDGVTDDGPALVRMAIAAPATGANIWGRCGATYYNNYTFGRLSTPAFTGKRGIGIYGQGVKFTARPTLGPESGIDDSQRAIFYFLDSPAYTISGDIVIDGKEPEFFPVDKFGAQSRDIKLSRSLAINYGVYARNSPDGRIDVTQITHCLFNVWCVASARDKVRGRLDWSGQLYPVLGDDLNFGAGIKISNSSDIEMDVQGTNNSNSLVEVEPDVRGGFVRARSVLCANAGVTITDSSDIELDVTTDTGYVGTRICQGSYNITGTIRSKNNQIWGVEIVNFGSYTIPIRGLYLNIIATGNGAEGLRMSGEPGSGGGIYDYDVNVIARGNNNNPTGTNVYVVGIQDGNLNGKATAGNRGLDIAFCNGLVVNMDLRGNSTVPYLCTGASIFDLHIRTTEVGNVDAYGIDFRYRLTGQATNTGTFQFIPLTEYTKFTSRTLNTAMALTAAAGGAGGEWADAGDLKWTAP